MSVAMLIPAETVALDRDQLEVLYRQLGPVGADKIVTHALEELAGHLTEMPVDYCAGRFEELRARGRALAAVAQQVGMTKLARVARDLADLATSQDAPALGAVVARLERIGDGSMAAVWDIGSA